MKEIKDKSKESFKLTTVNNPNIIQGLVSNEDKRDHIFMHLIESAKFNVGKNKVYVEVPANLIAFVCKVSFDKGYEGFVAFDAKSALIKHYEESLHAMHFRGLRMFIDTSAALRLIVRCCWPLANSFLKYFPMYNFTVTPDEKILIHSIKERKFFL